MRSRKSTPAPVSVKQETKTASPLAGMIDELGVLEERIEQIEGPLAPEKARAEVLRKQIERELHPAADAFAKEKGLDFLAVVTLASEQTKITSLKAVHDLLGPEMFIRAVEMTLEKLKALTTKDQFQSLVAVQRTGPRKVLTYRLGTKEAASALK